MLEVYFTRTKTEFDNSYAKLTCGPFFDWYIIPHTTVCTLQARVSLRRYTAVTSLLLHISCLHFSEAREVNNLLSFIHSFITIYKAHYMSAMPNQKRWRQSLGGHLSAK